MTQGEAIEKLKSGEIAATVLVARKPAQSIMRVRPGDGLSFLPIPYTKDLGVNYLPASLTHDDYPEIIPAGQTVDTIADGAILIAYNWPKGTDHYQRVEKFINALSPRIAEFRKPPITRNGARSTSAVCFRGGPDLSQRGLGSTPTVRRSPPSSNGLNSTLFGNPADSPTGSIRRNAPSKTKDGSRNSCVGGAAMTLTPRRIDADLGRSRIAGPHALRPATGRRRRSGGAAPDNRRPRGFGAWGQRSPREAGLHRH